jgi:hypothetical protein
MLAMPHTPPLPDSDDELGELPPLDGDMDEAAEPEAELDDLGNDGVALEDGTPEGDPADPIELDVLEEGETSWLNEALDATDVDLGAADLMDLDDERIAGEHDGDDVDVGDEGAALSDQGESGGLDAGDEGPLDLDEELRDSDLPALDADEDESVDSRLLEEPLTADESLPWAAQPWERVGAPLGLVAATAVACVSRGALVAARAETDQLQLFRVDLEGARDALRLERAQVSEVVALAADAWTVAAVSPAAGLVVSRDGGERFEAPVGGVGVADVRLVSGALWLRTRSGELLVSKRADRDFVRCPAPGAVAAIASHDASGIVAMVVDSLGRPIALGRGGVEGLLAWESISVPEASKPMVLAARAAHVAYSGRSGVVRRGTHGGWRSFTWDGSVTALAFVDDEGTLLAATYSEADDTTGLVRIDVKGAVAIVARIGATQNLREPSDPADGRALALACDDSRGVVWVAGGFGLAAFAIRPR